MRLFAILAIAFFMPLAASAQALGGLGGPVGEPFTLSVNPQYPVSYGTATISLTSNTLELAKATLTVFVGGKETYKGTVRTFSVPLGKAGSVTNVKVVVAEGGATYTKTLSLQPQDVVLVAEPIASVAPLYPGKPSVPLEGTVRVVAIAALKDASGKTASKDTYSYVWTVDGVRIADSSGIGKSALVVDSPLQYRARDVSVAVSTLGGSASGGASLSLTSSEPVVRIYEQHPLLGIRFERALSGSYAIQGAEATLFAVPFSLATRTGAPSIQWFLNGEPAQTGSTVTLRPTGSGQGSASLSLTASAGASATAFADLSVIFGAKPNTNLFGL